VVVAGTTMLRTVGQPIATITILATATTTWAFAFFSSLSCQKYTVYGWYASTWIMTRPLSSAGVCRTKRYISPPSLVGFSKEAVGFHMTEMKSLK
jgi:hypothetical protein